MQGYCWVQDASLLIYIDSIKKKWGGEGKEEELA